MGKDRKRTDPCCGHAVARKRRTPRPRKRTPEPAQSQSKRHPARIALPVLLAFVLGVGAHLVYQSHARNDAPEPTVPYALRTLTRQADSLAALLGPLPSPLIRRCLTSRLRALAPVQAHTIPKSRPLRAMPRRISPDG